MKEFVQDEKLKKQISQKSIKNILETTLVLNGEDHLNSDFIHYI